MTTRFLFLLLPALLMVAPGATFADTGAEPESGDQINWQVISSGGTSATSENFKLAGTSGQSAVGAGNSESFWVDHGYWQQLEPGPDYLCGDADGNDLVNISDAVYLIAYIFGGGAPPDPLIAGDADCNELVNISDAVYLIAYIFGGGPAPCENCP